MTDDRPLDLLQLRMILARKAWNQYKGDSDPYEVPSAFYSVTDLIIKESYNNVEKMIAETIKQRLNSLYHS